MRKPISIFVLIGVFVFAAARLASPQDARCSDATFSGAYAALSWSPGSSTLPPGTTTLSRFVADGAGNLTGTITLNLGGAVSTTTINGTVAFNADCTGSGVLAIPGFPALNITTWIKPDGSEGEDTGTTQGFDFLSHFVRIFPDQTTQQCSNDRILAGIHGFKFTGNINNVGPFVGIGTVQIADAAGTGQYTINVNGSSSSVTFTESFSLNADCTYTRTVTTSAGSVFHGFGAAVDGGRQLLEVSGDNGSSLALEAVKLMAGKR